MAGPAALIRVALMRPHGFMAGPCAGRAASSSADHSDARHHPAQVPHPTVSPGRRQSHRKRNETVVGLATAPWRPSGRLVGSIVRMPGITQRSCWRQPNKGAAPEATWRTDCDAGPAANNGPALRLGARVFLTESHRGRQSHRGPPSNHRNRPPALTCIACLLGGPRWLCLPRWLSVRNLAGCRSRAGRPWQNATSPARHSSGALAPGLGRTSEPEPTKSETRLESARLARIFRVTSAEQVLHPTVSSGRHQSHRKRNETVVGLAAAPWRPSGRWPIVRTPGITQSRTCTRRSHQGATSLTGNETRRPWDLPRRAPGVSQDRGRSAPPRQNHRRAHPHHAGPAVSRLQVWFRAGVRPKVVPPPSLQGGG